MIAVSAQPLGDIVRLLALLQPFHALAQRLQLQRLCLPLQLWMFGADTAKHLAHPQRLGGIHKAVARVPFRQCRQTPAQCAARQLTGVVR
ncbi:hypothetical protein D9M71_293550 [compost metagenome]